MRRASLFVFSLVIAIFTAPRANAGGFYVTDVGTRGMARAGAFVASPNSLLAMHYNPAGISFLRGLNVEASLTLSTLDLQFTRSCPCVDAMHADAMQLDTALSTSFKPSQTSTPLAIPFLAIGYGLPFYDLTFAFAVYGPTSGRHDWGALPPASSPVFEQAARNSSQRYSAIYAKNVEANFSLGAGIMPIQGLRLGATITMFQVGADQATHFWANLGFADTPEDPRFDVPVAIRFHRGFALSWSAGALYEIIPGLTIGASFRPERSITSDGTISVVLPMLLTDFGASVEGDSIDIDISTAPIGRAGVEYAMKDVFKIEAAVVAEWWSVHKEITVRPKNIVFVVRDDRQPLNEFKIVRNWRDVYSIRIGGELNMFEPMLGVRAGWFYEPSAIPTERVDPARVDLEKHGIALGLSTNWFGATLEISGMYVFLATTEIKESGQRVQAPLTEPLGSRELVTTVGNGRYNGNYYIGSASLSFSLDDAQR